MEVELALDIDQYEGYPSLMDKGWGDFAYKTVCLPTVFVGLELSIGFITSKGEENALSFVVVGVHYYLERRLLAVYIEFDEVSMLMDDLITEENGWRKESVYYL